MDMNLFETLKNGNIRRLDSQSASHCGGRCIDKELIEFLSSHTDSGTYKPVCDIKDPEYEDLISHFQTHKNTFDGLGSVTVRPPLRLLHSFRPSKNAIVIANKIKIDATVIKQWFNVCMTSVNIWVGYFLTSAKDVRVMLMIGEFGRCPYIQSQIRHEYPNVVLIEKGKFMNEVLKGALISVMPGNETPPLDTKVPTVLGLTAIKLKHYTYELNNTVYKYQALLKYTHNYLYILNITCSLVLVI